MTDDVVADTVKRYDETAKQYVELTFDFGKFKNLKYDIDKFIAYTKMEDLILDVGSGSGRDLNYLMEHNRRAIGIDMSKGLIEEAKKRTAAKILLMDMRKLYFEDDTFDGIWSCASLLHIPKSQTDQTMYEFGRVLKPEGVLYLSLKEGEGEKVDKNGKFFSYYRTDELADLVEKTGFKVLESYTSVDDRNITWISLFARKL